MKTRLTKLSSIVMALAISQSALAEKFNFSNEVSD